jgi:hypothetical protein
MRQISNYGDKRTLAFCAFCGGETGTRDHCPSRVFLDEPYPENLSVVPACSSCNSKSSADEEYFACLISCVIAGSTDPEELPREKTKRILKAKPFLMARIEKARSALSDTNVFSPEHERVSAVVIKLAQGHALYELHESCASSPAGIEYVPLVSMSDAQREAFENPQRAEVWPEVGSRAMQRLIEGTDATPSGWLNVQAERYRFNASLTNSIDVRIVIHEYLACHVYWKC